VTHQKTQDDTKMSKLSEFRSSFTTELARASRFEVQIPTASISDFDNKKLTLRCESAQLPGRHLETIQQKTYGPYEQLPYHTTYNDIDLTFIVSGDMSEKSFFDGWMEFINPTSTFDMEYKDNYTTNIIITQYDLAENPMYVVTLFEAYPINVNQLDLNWSSEDTHKLNVTFAYTYWSGGTTSSSSMQPKAIGANAGGIPVNKSLLNGQQNETNPWTYQVNGVNHVSTSTPPTSINVPVTYPTTP